MEASDAIVVLVQGPVTPDEAAQVCQRLIPLLRRSAGGAVTCRIAGPVDLSVVDSLLRLQLLVRRYGVRLSVQTTGPELAELLGLTGLDDLLALVGPEAAAPAQSLLEPGRQPEAGEQRRVEEVVHVAHPPV